MNPWLKIRILLLATTCGSVLFVLGKSILYPASSDLPVPPFVFPVAASLPEWQPVASNPLDNPTADNREYLSGRNYQYVQNGLSLDVEMRYLVNTDGNVKTYLKNYTGILSSADRFLPIQRQQQGVGFYSLFVNQGRAYLSACINPSGGSTVTGSQFKDNRNTYDVRSRRLLLWFIGQAELRDERCLWAHLSVPLKNSSPETAYQTLEKAWVSWYQWWSPRFPK